MAALKSPVVANAIANPLVLFFDLKTKSDNGLVQTLEHQERWNCETFQNCHVVELVAYFKGDQFKKKLYPPINKSAKGHGRSVLLEFLEWIDERRSSDEDQKIILIAHNNQFFHFHVLKSTFKAFDVLIPGYINFFDSMTLMKKIQLTDPSFDSIGVNACRLIYGLKVNQRNRLVECITEIASRQLGYDNFEHYLQDNVSEIWRKDLIVVNKFECTSNDHQHLKSGAWILFYEQEDMLLEKWKQVVDLSQRGKLDGIVAIKSFTMQDFTEGSEYSIMRGIWFYCSTTDSENIKKIGENLLVQMDYKDDSGFMHYDSDKHAYRIDVPKDNPFQKGKTLLDVEERFIKRLKEKMEIVEATYIEERKKDDIITDAMYHLKLNQDNLTEKYQELCKRWNDIQIETTALMKNSSSLETLKTRLEVSTEFMTVQYMKDEFDHLHHYMHHQLNELLKLSIGEETFNYMMPPLFTPMDDGGFLYDLFGKDNAGKIRNGLWCHRCIRIQSSCDDCFHTYFDLEGLKMASIIKIAIIEYEDGEVNHDDVTIEELRNTKMMIYDESDKFKRRFTARTGSQNYAAKKFNCMVKALDYMINERLLQERESKMSKEEYEKMTTEISKFLENVLYVDDDSIPKENSISDATRSSEEGDNQSLSNVAKEVNAKPTLHFRHSTSPSRDSRPTMSLSSSMSATTVSANAEKDKLTKMKQRKEARKERAEKKIKTVIVKEDQEKPYDFEKVLESLGEQAGSKDSPVPSSISCKSKRKKSKKQGKRNNNQFKNDSTIKEMLSPELGTNNESESYGQKDAISLLASSSPSSKDESKSSKVANERISVEVLQYLENVEQENQTQRKTLESLKKPMVYMEKLMQNYEKLQVKNKELEDARLCKVCMEDETCFVFIPCGHICTCENCAVNGDLKFCPICREKIAKRMKTFMS